MNSELSALDPALLERYGGQGPRYTSYPTVPQWSTDFGAREQEEALKRASAKTGAPLSVYVHVPFCESLCLYCGCTVQITRRADLVERYLDALESEIRRVSARFGRARPVVQLHWGGGTPTHLSSQQIRRLFAVLDESLPLAPGAEISIEVHPHVTRPEQMETLVALGFNRVSMGVQDIDADVQAAVQRHQTPQETQALIEQCRRLGVRGVNVDLMYGLPRQTERTFEATLDSIARWRPDRLAVYGYAHVPWLKPFQKALEGMELPETALRTRLFARAVERLGQDGYELIGLDHFALAHDELWQALTSGSLHRNFMGYTTRPAEDMLAFGMSAISEIDGCFYQNEPTTKGYEQCIAKEGLAAHRGLARDDEDELRRAAILDLMCRMQLDLDELEARWKRDDLGGHFEAEWRRLAPLADDGLIELEPRRVRVTPTGRLFLRSIAMCFDEYLHRPPGENGRRARFSRTL